MRRQLLFAASISIFALLAARATVGVAGGDAGKKGDGAWAAVSIEQGGKKLPGVDKLAIKLALAGGKYEVSFGGKVVESGVAKSDWTKKPIEIDIQANDGPNKGKTILAIAEIDGDSMRVCYDIDGKVRPREFATKEGEGQLLITYRREK